MVSVTMYLITVIFFIFVVIGLTIGMTYWNHIKIDRLENSWRDERGGYVDALLSQKQNEVNASSLLKTYNNATFVYEEDLPPNLRGDLN